MCDLCIEPPELGPDRGGVTAGRRGGAAVTYVNADKQDDLRHLAELALKFYDDKEKSFKVMKVCKVNRVGAGYYGLTFMAKEDGSEECPVFRGVVRVAGGKRALFCEIKDDDDDEVTLRPDDDDYVSSKRACEREDDCPPMKRGSSAVDGSDSFTPMETDQPSVRKRENLKGGCYRKHREEGNEVNSPQECSWPSDSVDSKSNKTKKAKKDTSFEVVGMIAESFREFVAWKKEERPSGIEIYEVVSKITGLTSTERFKAVEKLMDGNVERFRLLKALPDKEKTEWVYYLINS
ncbi:uncharacterized protein [Henckelia pumila]|uniref:uncharacterized protein n=1 Tax=Henckelia pumila TaxID=405737 RepID=UPI003C6E3FC6